MMRVIGECLGPVKEEKEVARKKGKLEVKRGHHRRFGNREETKDC